MSSYFQMFVPNPIDTRLAHRKTVFINDDFFGVLEHIDELATAILIEDLKVGEKDFYRFNFHREDGRLQLRLLSKDGNENYLLGYLEAW